MYLYDEYDQAMVNDRVKQFRGQVDRFLNGELTEDEFRPLRLMNGLYIQRLAPMLRVAVPYGLLSSKQLRKLADISTKYDKGYGHFTTRQNIQFNWPKLEDVPAILDELASVQMHAVQTSGNCIRNTTSDQFAGVAPDELEDPRPYCEVIRQWSTFHPEFAYLPRKFKIAVTGAQSDRAAVQVHDIGLRLVKNDAGEVGFEVLVGGGLGRTPVIGKVIRPFLPKQHLLSYLEAILRIYNLTGRRDNKYKARIKITVKETGLDKFRDLVEAEWSQIKDDFQKVTEAEIARVSKFFTEPNYEDIDSESATAALEAQLEDNQDFAKWVKHNTFEHKKAGYRAAFISLKAPDQAPGDCSDKNMHIIADLADKYSFGEMRVTHTQNIVLSDVKTDELFNLWQALSENELATANINKLTDMICCPGLDFCSLANARSLSIAQQINDKFDNLDYLYDLGDIRVNMSGCMNACGHHHVGHIGILGVDKSGEEFYQLTLGGSSANEASLGDRLGPGIPHDDVANAIENIVNVYVETREGEESFLETYRRVGVAPFKEKVYATH